MERLQPLVQGDLAALHDGAHRDGEVLAAFLFGAAEHARPLGRIGMIDDAAMRADGASRPQQLFEIVPSGGVVAKVWGAERVHDHLPC